MATLNVKSLPDDLYERLRARAHRSGRSIRGEVLRILQEALAVEERSAQAVYSEIRELRASYGSLAPGPSIDDLLAEDRRR